MSKAFSLLTLLLLVLGAMPLSHAAPVWPPAPVATHQSEVVAEAWRSFRPRFVPTECWFAVDDAPAIDGMVCGTVAPKFRS